jgi:polysaccharide export outer membrane protein
MKTLIIALMLLAQAVVGSTGGANEYIVGPQDVLEILVHGHEAYSTPRVVVDGDGTIAFPELGRVAVAGKSPRQIEEALKTALVAKQILTTPSMTVTVKEFRSQNIHVMGAVKVPGIFPIKAGAAMVATAIAEAGGFAENAGSYVVVVRSDGNTGDPAPKLADVKDEHKILIQRTDMEQARPESRIPLRNGDTIFVPKVDLFYVGGEVENPGEYVLRPNMTIAMAVNVAGGYTDRARKNPQIHRVIDGKLQKKDAKESDTVHAGDTVHIPQRRW